MNQKTASTAGQDLVDGDLTTGNFTIQAQMPMGKTITVSGYIYARSTLADINKQVDLLHDVIDRQRTKAEIPELEIKRDQRVIQLSQIRDHLVVLSKKQDNGGKLSSAEKRQIDELNINIERIKEDITKGEKAIEDARAALTKD